MAGRSHVAARGERVRRELSKAGTQRAPPDTSATGPAAAGATPTVPVQRVEEVAGVCAAALW